LKAGVLAVATSCKGQLRIQSMRHSVADTQSEVLADVESPDVERAIFGCETVERAEHS